MLKQYLIRANEDISNRPVDCFGRYPTIQEINQIIKRLNELKSKKGLIEEHNEIINNSIFKDLLREKEKKEKQISRKNKKGYIYIIKSGKYYKIGVTNNLTERLGTIETATPNKVSLIYEEHIKSLYIVESKIHKVYSNKRIKGEWFDLIMNDVESIKNFIYSFKI